MDWHDSDPDIRQCFGEGAAAIIPVGSIEQHGAHLPVSTDSDIVGAVAAGIGLGKKFVVLPTITTGVSFEHMPFFQISIREDTLGRLLDDVCDSLHANGVSTVFVINGHYGNRKALDKFIRARGDKPQVHAMSYWRFSSRRFDHAGFVETSLMLAISDKVDMQRAQKGLVTQGMSDEDIRKIKLKAIDSFPEATGNGIWGDPRQATVQDGKRLLQEIIENLREECKCRLNGAPNEILI